MVSGFGLPNVISSDEGGRTRWPPPSPHRTARTVDARPSNDPTTPTLSFKESCQCAHCDPRRGLARGGRGPHEPSLLFAFVVAALYVYTPDIHPRTVWLPPPPPRPLQRPFGRGRRAGHRGALAAGSNTPGEGVSISISARPPAGWPPHPATRTHSRDPPPTNPCAHPREPRHGGVPTPPSQGAVGVRGSSLGPPLPFASRLVLPALWRDGRCHPRPPRSPPPPVVVVRWRWECSFVHDAARAPRGGRRGRTE